VWIQQDLGAKGLNGAPVNYFEISNLDNKNIATDFTLMGSADGANWTPLVSAEGREPVYGADTSGYYFENDTGYRYYRLVVNGVAESENGQVSIAELTLYVYGGAMIKAVEKAAVREIFTAGELIGYMYNEYKFISPVETAEISEKYIVTEDASVSEGERRFIDAARIEDLLYGCGEGVTLTLYPDNTMSAGERVYLHPLDYLEGSENVGLTAVSNSDLNAIDTALFKSAHMAGNNDFAIFNHYNPNNDTHIIGPQKMTSNTTPAPFVISASSTDTAGAQYRAFSGDWSADVYGGGWRSDYLPTAWLKIYMGQPYILQRAAFLVKHNTAPGSVASFAVGGAPRNFTIEGSNDDAAWDILLTVTDNPYNTHGQVAVFDVPENGNSYLYFRINVTLKYGASSTPLTLGPVQLLGHE